MTDRRECPFCAEPIRWTAIVCPHCGAEYRKLGADGVEVWESRQARRRRLITRVVVLVVLVLVVVGIVRQIDSSRQQAKHDVACIVNDPTVTDCPTNP